MVCIEKYSPPYKRKKYKTFQLQWRLVDNVKVDFQRKIYEVYIMGMYISGF